MVAGGCPGARHRRPGKRIAFVRCLRCLRGRPLGLRWHYAPQAGSDRGPAIRARQRSTIVTGLCPRSARRGIDMPDRPVLISVGAVSFPLERLVGTPRTPLGVMDFVVALLSDPTRRNQGSAASDLHCNTLSPYCTTAARWGLEGGIDRAVSMDGIDREAPGLSEPPYAHRRRLTEAVYQLFDVPVDRFNDAATHRLVMMEARARDFHVALATAHEEDSSSARQV